MTKDYVSFAASLPEMHFRLKDRIVSCWLSGGAKQLIALEEWLRDLPNITELSGMFEKAISPQEQRTLGLQFLAHLEPENAHLIIGAYE